MRAIGMEDLYQDILSATAFLDPSVSLVERLYCIVNDISDRILCAYSGCDNPVRYELASKRYHQTCCRSCSRKVMNSNGSYQNPFNDPDIQEKARRNKFEKHESHDIQEKVKQTLMEKYGVTNVSQLESVKTKKAAKDTPEIKARRVEKIRKTCLERYGVTNVSHVEEHIDASMRKRYQPIDYTFSTGETYKVFGYEPTALKFLEGQGYTSEDVQLIGRKMIKYTDSNEKIRRYLPDIVIPKEDRIIEVKSTYTITVDVDKNICKWNACVDQGYSMQIWICSKDDVLRIVEWKRGSEYPTL